MSEEEERTITDEQIYDWLNTHITEETFQILPIPSDWSEADFSYCMFCSNSAYKKPVLMYKIEDNKITVKAYFPKNWSGQNAIEWCKCFILAICNTTKGVGGSKDGKRSQGQGMIVNDIEKGIFSAKQYMIVPEIIF